MPLLRTLLGEILKILEGLKWWLPGHEIPKLEKKIPTFINNITRNNFTQLFFLTF